MSKQNGKGEIVDKLIIECPECETEESVPETWDNKEVQCLCCENIFTIQI